MPACLARVKARISPAAMSRVSSGLGNFAIASLSSARLTAAFLNGSEERPAMMRSALQWKRGGVDGERVGALEPFERILERDGRSPFSRMEPPHEMGLPPPINMNFKAHGRDGGCVAADGARPD